MKILNEILKWISTLSEDETKYLVDSILMPLLMLIEGCDRQRVYISAFDGVFSSYENPCDICQYQEVCYTVAGLTKSIIGFIKKKIAIPATAGFMEELTVQILVHDGATPSSSKNNYKNSTKMR